MNPVACKLRRGLATEASCQACNAIYLNFLLYLKCRAREHDRVKERKMDGEIFYS